MRQTSKAPTTATGFTLIEMIVVVLIVGILASAAMPLAALHQRRQQEQELRANLRTLRIALDAYRKAWDEGRIQRKEGESGYPPNLTILVEGVPDARHPSSKRIYFLRRLPRDPLASPELTAEESWGLRSYESPPSNPQPGVDVFDVYSRAAGRGIDGIPYREW